jgi:hypothetical protein
MLPFLLCIPNAVANPNIQLSSSKHFESLSSLTFRNPPGLGLSTNQDSIKLHPQCVLYSEIDNVTSVNKGWDFGSGAGWELNYPYSGDGTVPPTGIRSSVPLGGMGTGNFELRGDGTFRQWCIESQSPGGGAKLDIGALDDAVLGVRAGSEAALLRTRPPGGLPGVAAMEYEGAVPVSKLAIKDPRFPVQMALYAHGKILPWDDNASMTPAVAFTLTIQNPTPNPVNVSLLLSLPLATQPNTGRVDTAGVTRTHAPAANTTNLCKQACDSAATCKTWVLDSKAGTCFMLDGVPQNVFSQGVVSGIKGQWGLPKGSQRTGSQRTLVHDRNSDSPAPGPAPTPASSCNNATMTADVDIRGGAILGATSIVSAGQEGLDQCRASW